MGPSVVRVRGSQDSGEKRGGEAVDANADVRHHPGMASETRRKSDDRLERACAAAGLTDPRETYRDLLRDLRGRDPDSFARASGHYQSEVLPRLAGDAEPIDTWIEYGRVLGELGANGRMYSIDATGLADVYRPPYARHSLVLFVPDDGTRGSFVAAMPITPTAAQSATVDMLVHGRLSLG
jgi:hypothetical protein